VAEQLGLSPPAFGRALSIGEVGVPFVADRR
jgi:hypothetical protein